MKKCLLVLTTLLVCINISAADRRTDKNTLTVMTYNTHFMWDGLAPVVIVLDIPLKNYLGLTKTDKAKKQMAKIVAIIKSNNPEIINLVGLESLESLNILNNEFLQGLGYRVSLYLGNGSVAEILMDSLGRSNIKEIHINH